jgi:hypothetical protein
MTKYALSGIVLFSVLSCGSRQDTGNPVTTVKDSAQNRAASPAAAIVADYFVVDKDSMLIPSFAIEVNLSAKASEKLLKDKETIVVDAWFTGSPKDTSSKEYADIGHLFIQSASVELSNSRVARFEGVKFSKARYDSLADKDIRVLVNIYSGRRSTADNLLDCAILSQKMSAVKGRTIPLTGKLISETVTLP